MDSRALVVDRVFGDNAVKNRVFSEDDHVIQAFPAGSADYPPRMRMPSRQPLLDAEDLCSSRKWHERFWLRILLVWTIGAPTKFACRERHPSQPSG